MRPIGSVAEPIAPYPRSSIVKHMEDDVVGKILSALIGAEVEKRRQESGLKGAVLGAVAFSLAKRLGPIGLALGGAYAAKKIYDRSKGQPATA